MTSKEFKQCYLKWSKAVAFFIPTMLFAIVLCDHLLGFDFSKDMYVIAFIACSIMMAFLSTSWISALNLESRFLNCKVERVIDQLDEDITLSDIADCIKKEGYTPDTRKCDNGVNYTAQKCRLTAEEPGNYIELEKSDAAPVKTADNAQRQANSVH